jgi:hypothetical protein
MTAADTLFTGLASSTAADEVAASSGRPAEGSARCTDELPPTAGPAGQFDDQAALLRRVFDARAIIEQAKGMLMAQHRVPADRAFQLLRAESQRTNTKLRDVAAHHVLLHSGQFTVRRCR